MRLKKARGLGRYTTSDLYEASALALHTRPVGLEPEGNRFVFVFQPEARSLAHQYWTGSLHGDLRAYAERIKAAKDWVFSMRRRDSGIERGTRR